MTAVNAAANGNPALLPAALNPQMPNAATILGNIGGGVGGLGGLPGMGALALPAPAQIPNLAALAQAGAAGALPAAAAAVSAATAGANSNVGLAQVTRYPNGCYTKGNMIFSCPTRKTL
eukprot:1082473-Prorocentrum_minimum.AAC.1